MNQEVAAARQPFAIKDCALMVQATGARATLLAQFRRELEEIDVASVYHHFWGTLLQPRFDEREYGNDFAAWVRHGVHDAALAERLAALDPVRFSNLELLRQEMLEIIDARLDEVSHLAWVPPSAPFEFACSQIVVFDTKRELHHPRELCGAIAELSTSSIFYHFIDARRRTESGHDDFSDWIAGFENGYEALQAKLTRVDPFFGSLSELRATLVALFGGELNGGGA